MKKYKITYPIVAGVFCVLSVIFFGFVFKAGVLPTAWMTIGFTGFALSVSRIVLHLVDKDKAIKSWQQSTYALLASLAWVFAAFAQKLGVASCFTMIACSFGTIFAGTFCKDFNEDGIPDIFQAVEKVYTEDTLMTNMLYKFEGDVLGAKFDKTRPVCVCNGKPYTVVKALAEGFTGEAELAMEYIRNLFK